MLGISNSRNYQKLIIRNVRISVSNTKKVIVEYVRIFSDDTKKGSNNDRPVYTPNNPVSIGSTSSHPKSLHTNPEYFPDNCNINTTACTNPECELEDSTKERPMYTAENPATLDNPPTTCCMSGCNNCVYIVWADALSKQMAEADPEVAKKILNNVQDPSMKTFLEMELRNLGILKKK